MKPLKKKLDTNFVRFIPWKHIELRWGKREYRKFCKWMGGQTVTDGGAYVVDVLTYADQRNRGVIDPEVYD